MNKSKALQLCEIYEAKVLDSPKAVGLTKDKMTEMLHDMPQNTFDTLAHVLTMFGRMKLMVNDDVDKFCRWLGFVQGILWTEYIYTIEELKDHNRAIFAGKPGVVFDNGHTPHSNEDEEGYGG